MFREFFPGRKNTDGAVPESRTEELVEKTPASSLISELEKGGMNDSEKAFRIANDWELLSENEKKEAGDYFGTLRNLDVKIFKHIVDSDADELAAKNPECFDLSEENVAFLLESRAGRSFFKSNPTFGNFDKVVIAQYLADIGKFSVLATSKEFFLDADLSGVMVNILNSGGGNFLLDNLDLFPHADHSILALDMLESQFTGLRTFSRHVVKMRNLDRYVVERILDILQLQHNFSRGLEYIFDNVSSFSPKAVEHFGWMLPTLPTNAYDSLFTNLDKLPSSVVEAYLKKMRPLSDDTLNSFLRKASPALLHKHEAEIVEDALARHNVLALFKNLEKLSVQWHARIYEQALKEKIGGLGAYIGLLQGVDASLYADLFKSTIFETDLLVHLETFPSLDTLDYAESLYATKPDLLTKYFDKFKSFDKNDFIQKHFTDENWTQFAEYVASLEGLSRDNAKEVIDILEVINFEKAIQLNLAGSPPYIPELARFSLLMAERSTRELYALFAAQNFEEATFLKSMKEVEVGLYASDPAILEKIIENPNLTTFAMATVRYKTSQWGSHDNESFRALLLHYLEHKDIHQPLPEGYVSGTIEVQKQRKVEIGEYVYSPEFRERWQTLLPSLIEAQEINSAPEKLVGLYSRFTEALHAEKQEVLDALERAPNEHAKTNLERRLSELSSVSLNSIPEMAEAFEKLFDRKKRPELTELFRLYGFYVALHGRQRTSLENYSKETPSREEIAEILELVQHVTHQETWEKSEYFASDGAQKALAALFHTKALEDELTRMARAVEGNLSNAVQALTVLPSRDLLTEFSGHIGDACWASRQNILDDYPNISSLTFQKGEVLAGAALLIDTATEDGVPLTIIRGLNPQETIINRLDMASFIDALRNYLGPMVKERGRQLAIVIDDHSGGSASNRPLLYAYLSGLRTSLTRAKGLSEEDTTFNGYDITPHTYLLP
jgi:hypothetical protein